MKNGRGEGMRESGGGFFLGFCVCRGDGGMVENDGDTVANLGFFGGVFFLG